MSEFVTILDEVVDSIVIKEGEKIKAPFLTSVGSVVQLQKGATFEAPALTSVKMSVEVQESARFEAPALTSVGHSIYVQGGATFEAPVLISVWGAVLLQNGATFEAPALTSVGLINYETNFLGYKIQVFDGLGCVVLSEKVVDDIIVRKCKNASFKDGKLIGQNVFVVSKEHLFSHGNTLKEAVEDLNFKLDQRDLTKYKSMPKNTLKTIDEWIYIYRVITGACRFGINDFIKTQKLKKEYTLTDVLQLTRDQYGYEKFVQIVT